MTHSELEKEIKQIMSPFDNGSVERTMRDEAIAQLLASIDKHTKKYVEEILPKRKKNKMLEGKPDARYIVRTGYNQALSDIRKKVK